MTNLNAGVLVAVVSAVVSAVTPQRGGQTVAVVALALVVHQRTQLVRTQRLVRRVQTVGERVAALGRSVATLAAGASYLPLTPRNWK